MDTKTVTGDPKKKGSGGGEFGHSSSPFPINLPCLLHLPLLKKEEEKMMNKAPNKASQEDSNDDEDEEAAEARFNAMMEDMYGLTVMKGGPSIKEDNECMTIKMEIGGVGKEDVKVTLLNQTLVIKADDTNNLTLYVPDHEYKSEEMKAVIKDGVLTVVVPKKKAEERKDAIQVVVED